MPIYCSTMTYTSGNRVKKTTNLRFLVYLILFTPVLASADRNSSMVEDSFNILVAGRELSGADQQALATELSRGRKKATVGASLYAIGFGMQIVSGVATAASLFSSTSTVTGGAFLVFSVIKISGSLVTLHAGNETERILQRRNIPHRMFQGDAYYLGGLGCMLGSLGFLSNEQKEIGVDLFIGGTALSICSMVNSVHYSITASSLLPRATGQIYVYPLIARDSRPNGIGMQIRF